MAVQPIPDSAYNKIADPASLLIALHKKFGGNLESCMKCGLSSEMKKVELLTRALESCGSVLSNQENTTVTQQEICSIFNEIFSDVTCSTYFASCGLDKPAQMVLRRALELGIGIAYLWDMPHEFWGWNSHDCDLKFKEMLEHIESASYRTFIHKVNSDFDASSSPIDATKAKELYRKLSNVVHGKFATFESNIADRFQFTESDFRNHLEIVEAVASLLLTLWCNRFNGLSEKLKEVLPQLEGSIGMDNGR